ncbi:MAG: hypothetical protein JWR76_366 [Mucilaginibacter sp.]|nr:hypothetical protein [Mucilaginibacter sp.]
MKKYILLFLSLSLLAVSHGYCQPKITKHKLLTPNQIKAIVDTVCDKIERGYVFADKGKQISDHLHVQLKAGIYNKYTGSNELATKLTNDMRRIYYDGHMAVRFDTTVPNGPANISSQPNPQPAPPKEENFNLKKIEVLPGNVGYFRLDGFTGNRDVQPVLESALHFLERSQALIIDVRYNGGGSGGMVNLIESYLFNKRTEMNGFIGRSGKDTIHIEVDPAEVKGFTLNMPIYILTSHRTFSAAEDFAYGMQSVHRAQTVGEASGGGAHPVQTSPIGCGLVIRIPIMRSYNPYTHKDWEGVGVLPDIRCSAESALDVALSNIYRQILTNSKNLDEKGKYQWLRDRVTAQKVTVASKLLQSYTGTYGHHLRLFVKDGCLYCTDLLMNNLTFELHSVNTGIFYSGPESDLKITMIKSRTGVCSALNASWLNGDEIIMNKIN